MLYTSEKLVLLGPLYQVPSYNTVIGPQTTLHNTFECIYYITAIWSLTPRVGLQLAPSRHQSLQLYTENSVSLLRSADGTPAVVQLNKSMRPDPSSHKCRRLLYGERVTS